MKPKTIRSTSAILLTTALVLGSFTTGVKDVQKSDLEFYCGDSYKAPVSKRRVNPIWLKIKGVKNPVQITAGTACTIDAEIATTAPSDASFTFNTITKGKGMYYYVELDGDEIEIYFRKPGDDDWEDYCEIEVHGDHVHIDRDVKLQN